MKPKQYLLVGFPYSGKTTLAKELEKSLGFAHINIDQLKFDEGYTEVGKNMYGNTIKVNLQGSC